ncbi:hypothetical protein BN2537_4857 [Streptomyces venezuelae]|nr:hypothetical protein BN2537_4857 [Streptomyces venezuelae]
MDSSRADRHYRRCGRPVTDHQAVFRYTPGELPVRSAFTRVGRPVSGPRARRP